MKKKKKTETLQVFTLNFVRLVLVKKQQIKPIGGWMGRQCLFGDTGNVFL